MISERLRKLRKELNLSQSAFGQSLGVGRDVIGNIEYGRVEIKEHIIKLICSEFNVNEEWLRTGDGDMFKKDETFSLDKFAQQRNMSNLELDILKAYFELDPQLRHQLINHFKNKFASSETVTPQPVLQVQNKTAVQLAEEAYIKSRSISAQKTILSASNSTEEEKNQEQAK